MSEKGLTPDLVKQRLSDAKQSLKVLSKRTEEKLFVRREVMIGYCNETIILCQMLLALMERMKRYE